MMVGPDLEVNPGLKDPWGRHKRLMCGLAEAYTILHMMAGDDERAGDLVATALEVPYSFAGFQVPACLTLAESISICKPDDFAALSKALEKAQEAAHNIQDALFCARMTARVNAMRAFWWPDAPGAAVHPLTSELLAIAVRLREHPEAAEFAALHYIRHAYEGRAGARMTLPLSVELREAATLRQLAEAFKQPLEAFEKLNYDRRVWERLAEIATDSALKNLMQENAARAWSANAFLDPGVPVLVPDPGFATYIAARLSARALADPELAQLARQDERVRIIQKLVPVAGPNATALYTVLSRLLLAVGLRIPLPLTALADLAPYSEEEPEDGVLGELTSIQELTSFVP
jgi:hypothetical protein